jgi:hypothetical protein
MNRVQPQADFFDNVSVYFDEAASFTQHPKGLLDQIKICNSVYSFKFPCAPNKATRLFPAGGRNTVITSCL